MRLLVLILRTLLGRKKPVASARPMVDPLGGFTIGDEVKMKGGCPYAWHIYAAWPYSDAPLPVHLKRWEAGKFVYETFVDVRMLVKI